MKVNVEQTNVLRNEYYAEPNSLIITWLHQNGGQLKQILSQRVCDLINKDSKNYLIDNPVVYSLYEVYFFHYLSMVPELLDDIIEDLSP